jgi:predicted O-methyltransferase YrrM
MRRLCGMNVPPGFDRIAALAWHRASTVAGFIGEAELGALLALAACAAALPAPGAMVEIGSFKGRSTVGLATLARELALAPEPRPVVSIDPHTSPSPTDPGEASYDAFTAALGAHGLTDAVEAHRATSAEVARGWRRPIRLLWIDGDHTLAGARADFDLYAPFLVPGGIVAIHDALHFFEGPIRVFVEQVLGSDRFGPAGFCKSIAWAQFRPTDGVRWARPRRRLARRAARLLPLVAPPRCFEGWNKLRYKATLLTVPHRIPPPAAIAARLSGFEPPPAAAGS